MDKNTKMWLTVGAVGVVAYVLLRKKKSDTIQGEPSEQDLGQDPADGGDPATTDTSGGGDPAPTDTSGDDPAGGVVDPPPPPEVFRFSISSDTAGALQLQYVPTPNLVGDAQGFIPFARIEAGETLTFEIPADVPADVPVDMGYVAPEFVVAYINYEDRTQSLQYTIGLNDDYREIRAATYDSEPLNLLIRRPIVPIVNLVIPPPSGTLSFGTSGTGLNGWDNRTINLAD